MWRTLGGLAAAMTSTAALLGYIDPSATLQPRPLSQDEMGRLADGLVADDVLLVPGRWRTIDVVATRAPIAAGTTLAATAGGDLAHFYIDAWGRPSRGPRWVNQSPVPRSPGVVRIDLALSESSPTPTVAQQQAVESLTAALVERLAESH